jgi:DNA-binding transcriptional ArsR family regulator
MLLRPELAIAQTIGEKPVYHINELSKITESRATAYRILSALREAGFAERAREGFFTLRSSLFQPFNLWSSLLPSLQALKQARFFGLSYNENDVRLAREILKGVITLDYRANEITKLQSPHLFFIYVENPDQAANMLKKCNFSEGTKGRVVLLPRIGEFRNEIQRVYLDCIAYGGRSLLDAIAIEILHNEDLDPNIRGTFKTEDVLKVREELDAQSGTRSDQAN